MGFIIAANVPRLHAVAATLLIVVNIYKFPFRFSVLGKSAPAIA